MPRPDERLMLSTTGPLRRGTRVRKGEGPHCATLSLLRWSPSTTIRPQGDRGHHQPQGREEEGIHGEGWVSVSESTTLAVTVGRENDAQRGAMNMKLKISGMSCGHCVSHVKSALEGIEGVSQADVSLENHEAEVTLSDQVNDADLFGAVEAAGYQAEAG